MTRVGNVDQLLMLLRERLQRIDRSRDRSGGRTEAVRSATSKPIARLQAVDSLGQLSEEDFRRTMVRALLAEELGEAVANDPAFQGVAEDVFRIIGESEEGRALIDTAARQLRAES